jgi:diacylglycerol kinase
MVKNISEKQRFSIVERARSFNHAFRGLSIVMKTQHNMWIHGLVALFVLFLGFYFNINSIEWILIIFVIGFVLVTETLNTALEIDIDLTSPTYHPYARDTKDVASGAVLISIVVAVIVGLIIFIPKIF